MPLKPPVSSDARQTIKSAFEQLEKTIRPEDSHGFSTTTIEDVRKATLAIEEQLASRNSLRNMRRLLPLLAGLEHYSKSMDILCNGTPYLPWIWAPITLVLRIASEFIVAFERIMAGYSQIAQCLGRFQILQTALGSNRDFQQTLAVFYSNIVKFHEHAYIFVRRKSWRLLFVTSWGRFERRFENILDDMKRHEKLVDLHANAHSVSDVRQMRDDIKTWRDDSLVLVRKWHEKQAAKQYDSIVSWLKCEDADQTAIFDAISSEGSKFAGTCSWVLANSIMKSWLGKASGPSIVLMQGTAGSGKSVLISQVVKFMKKANMSLLYHFCSQRYASSITYEQILRSILLQLLRKDDELVAHVYEDYVLGKRIPTIQHLETLLYNLFTVASKDPCQSEYIWIIIDGLNECDQRTQTGIISLLNQLTNKLSGEGDTICKTLISSRTSPHITQRLRRVQSISLTEERDNVKRAIRQYVSQRLRAMHEKLAQLELTRKDLDNIEWIITDKADGMFLYARLILDYLSKNIFFNGNEMKESINELPEALTEFYRKILVQILIQLDQRSVSRIKSIFGWIAFAKRPLKRMEFLSALTFSDGDTDVINLVPKYVLDICGALLEERSDTTITFIHITVKEFLQSSSSNIVILESEATIEHCMSTLACLVCGSDIFLGNTSHHIKALRVVKGIHGFHVYATEFWTEYFLSYVASRPCNDSSAILDLALRLADRLSRLPYTSQVPSEATPITQPVDEKMKFLEEWPLLYKLIETFLRGRSLKRLEHNLIQELQHTTGTENETLSEITTSHQTRPSCSTAQKENNGISFMLSSYQEIVRYLLQQDEYPGVSADDLYLFKSQFQSSAFTCRLSFCPRATNGFVSEDLRRQHEIAHTQLSVCTIPECKYPPFPSIKALKSHINKHHRPEAARLRPIRKGGNNSLRQRFLDTRIQTGMQGRKFDDKPEAVPGDNEDSDPTSTTATIRTRQTPRGTSEGFEERTRKTSKEIGFVSELEDHGICNLDEILNAPVSSMGFRGCAIANCSTVRLETGSKTGPESEGIPDPMSFHYWNCHHADSMAQCAVTECQMLFSSNYGLQAHYEQRHTALFCEICDVDSLEGFASEEELRYHWRSNHLILVRRWVCDDPRQGDSGLSFKMSYDSCKSCSEERRFSRRYDAIEHLVSQHVGLASGMSQGPLVRFLGLHVRAVRAYEVMQKVEEWAYGDNESSEDEDLVDDGMFFVQELA